MTGGSTGSVFPPLSLALLDSSPRKRREPRLGVPHTAQGITPCSGTVRAGRMRSFISRGKTALLGCFEYSALVLFRRRRGMVSRSDGWERWLAFYYPSHPPLRGSFPPHKGEEATDICNYAVCKRLEASRA